MQSAACVGKVSAMSRPVRSRAPSLVGAAITRRGQRQGRGSGPTPPTATSQHLPRWDRAENRHLNSLSKGHHLSLGKQGINPNSCLPDRA